jgi:His-Xaa-Ser system radical SAM maturase HxsC
MIHLHSKNNLALTPISHEHAFISKITTNAELPPPLRSSHTLIWKTGLDQVPIGFGLVLVTAVDAKSLLLDNHRNVLLLAPELAYLKDHDVIKFRPNDFDINVLYRWGANSNSFLVTERCNSFCIMCSQPPRDIDDHYLVDDMLAALPLINQDTPEIGITGGEPTLWGDDFINLIQASKTHLPRTALHILSNGRNFKSLELAMKVAKIKHSDLMIGIPLYADYSQLHDFIVQAENAFDDTIRGILNLKRCRVPVEIRVVIHKKNYHRLPQLAEFITRNLLFANHVAFMGLEIMGFAKSNLNALWIDPYDYRDEIEEAVNTLSRYGMRVSIYNTPLCIIPEPIRRFSVNSISDWKNDFLEECGVCKSIQECGGFFSSNLTKKSAHLKAF